MSPLKIMKFSVNFGHIHNILTLIVIKSIENKGRYYSIDTAFNLYSTKLVTIE